jgi:hypothetical protein
VEILYCTRTQEVPWPCSLRRIQQPFVAREESLVPNSALLCNYCHFQFSYHLVAVHKVVLLTKPNYHSDPWLAFYGVLYCGLNLEVPVEGLRGGVEGSPVNAGGCAKRLVQPPRSLAGNLLRDAIRHPSPLHRKIRWSDLTTILPCHAPGKKEEDLKNTNAKPILPGPPSYSRIAGIHDSVAPRYCGFCSSFYVSTNSKVHDPTSTELLERLLRTPPSCRRRFLLETVRSQ